MRKKTVDNENTNSNKKDNENINNKKDITPSKSMKPTTSQRINTLKLNINALSRISWLQDRHIDIAFEDIKKK